MKGVQGIWVAALAGAACFPDTVHAQISDPKPGQGTPATLPRADPESPAARGDTIVSDDEFEAAIPRLTDSIDAPLDPIPGAAPPPDSAEQAADVPLGDTLDAIPAESAEFAQPLAPVGTFDPTPVRIEGVEDTKTIRIRYTTAVEGLDAIGLEDRFRDLSALEDGDGEGANAAMVAARAREDEALAVRLMRALGYYDGTAISAVEQDPGTSRLRATITAIPGALYTFESITIDSEPTAPPGLIEQALALKAGDPIEAERVQGAEANVTLRLGQQGYPFIQLSQRDILLDEVAHAGAYTLPVTLGPRASFGAIRTEGERAFDADHIRVLRRFREGQLYDTRHVDDLREALIATSLFSTVSVEPVRTGRPGPEGTETVDLLVRQQAGPPRTLAAEAGYGTGQGFRIEGSWTHRNLFPPEGALIVSGVLGTQEQGVSGTFRRQNAGQRDRTVQIIGSVNHSDYEAFESYTGSLAARISRDSTPIWQKRWTYFYGVELVGSNEDRFNFARGRRDRGTWLIAALPGYVGYDTSDDLLNPTRGFRVKLNASPETSVRGAARPYGRFMLEGTAYYPVTGSIVIAGRARAGSIVGIGRDDLPPSRRYYAGGGGSVRGFGYQELGPRSPDGRPVGGRAFSEFALEARYRFGNFGIVPFIDAGQVYEGIYPPPGENIRFGAGIGGRFYTNFGPLRVDVATPINRKPGESKVALYISIGQAF